MAAVILMQYCRLLAIMITYDGANTVGLLYVVSTQHSPNGTATLTTCYTEYTRSERARGEFGINSNQTYLKTTGHISTC